MDYMTLAAMSCIPSRYIYWSEWVKSEPSRQDTAVFSDRDKVAATKRKLELWCSSVENSQPQYFPILDNLLSVGNLMTNGEGKNHIVPSAWISNYLHWDFSSWNWK